MIIDFHTHCFPDELAPRATAVLAKRAGIPQRLAGTIKDLKRSMKKAGVSSSVVLGIATKPMQTVTINDWSREINDGQIIAFGSVHPEYEDWKKELERIKEIGLKGIKLHPDYQEFFVDEQRMFPIYEKAFELGLIVVFHAGVDIGLPPPVHCTPAALRKVVDAFPGGNIVAAHMGGYDCWNDVEKYLVGRDVYFDTSYSLDKIGRETFSRIAAAHGCKRILFATDSPWTDQEEEINRLKSFGLSPEAGQAILYGNAARLLGLEKQGFEKQVDL